MRQPAAVGDGGSGGGQGEVRICQDTSARRRTSSPRTRASAHAPRSGVAGAHRQPAAESHAEDAGAHLRGPGGRSRGLALSWLDAKAAAAHVTIYSLMLDRSQTDASQRPPEASRRPTGPAAGRPRLHRAGDARRRLHIMSNSDFAFRRLALELSGYYLLGFEPEDRDRGGTAHTIAVTVKRRGVTVRSRRQFRIDPGAAKTLDSQVVAALRDPLPAAEIPVKLATSRSAIRSTTSCGCSLARISIARSIRTVSSPPATSSLTSTASWPPVRWTRCSLLRRAGDPALLQHRGRGRRQVHGQARRRRRCRTAGKCGDAR